MSTGPEDLAAGQFTTALSDIEFTRMDGSIETLAEYTGHVVLVVNVASRCGLTPQYEALQKLYADYREQGFTILGFPANDFNGQEPGTDAEIAEFCATQYSVTFPLMSKIHVGGDDQHPLYTALTRQLPTADGKAEFRQDLRGHGIIPTDDPDVLWNFEKFLVAKDGTVAARFAPTVTPEDPALLTVIHIELTK